MIDGGPQQVQRRSRSVGAWLAYLLLATILVIAAWAVWLVLQACGFQFFGRTVVFFWCQDPPAVVRNLADLEDRNRLLQDQVHDAQLALMTPDACGPAVRPDDAMDPVPPPDLEDDPAPVEDAAIQCAPDQVLRQPREVAIVLDGSGSMQYSVDVPEQLERRYLEAWEAASRGGGGNLFDLINQVAQQERVNALDQQLRNIPGRSRMAVAHEVLEEAVRQAPAQIAMDLTTFRSCTNVRANSYGTNRAGLQSAISALTPGSGTPLARAMQVAANNLEGGDSAEDFVNMVIVTDGNDSCGGNPCAVARTLKQQKPGLLINVVDLSQSQQLSCVAEATGGTYRRSRGVDPAALVSAIQEAAGYSGQGQCRPVSQGASD